MHSEAAVNTICCTGGFASQKGDVLFMTSAERREARYRRRQAVREQKAREAGGASFESVMSFGNLCRAGKQCCKGVRWKSSTIYFETYLLRDSLESYNTLYNGTRKFRGFQSFMVIEHGKKRDIDALPIAERAVQKCLCSNLLAEAYSRSFIYDNSASQKGKGMDFQILRLKKHLHDHFRKYGTEGGIYQYDFKNYFGSLPRDEIKRRASEKIFDDKLRGVFCDFVDDFRLMKSADKNAERGVGLGSEISQIIALDYASPIDHYIKEVWQIHGYGRYNDDGYIISNSIAELEAIKECVRAKASELGLTMNEGKNVITPFKHHSFTFLKMRFSLKDNGKVVVKMSRKSIKSMRRKMSVFRRWVDDGKIAVEDVITSYQSWRAHAKKCNSYNTLQSMDERFVTLFAAELATMRKPFRCTLKAVKTRKGWIYVKRGQNRMQYITHHRFKDKAICGQANIPYGTELTLVGNCLCLLDGRPICYNTSENAKKHFARNDDGKGLDRGKLTYAIAYSQRINYGENGRRQRFTDGEIELLEGKWSCFLRQDVEAIIFNEEFFAAKLEDLQAIAEELKIKIRR